MSTDNISDVNFKHQITLSNLEEANTYNFTVVSTNCIGSASTVAMDFTTLTCKFCHVNYIFVLLYKFCLVSSPVIPVTIPIIISDVFVIDSIPVINDTTVNLTWYAPNQPNGYISGYNIDVFTKGNVINHFIPSTPNTSVYTVLISGLSKYIFKYQCSYLYISDEVVSNNITIGAVNELGQGINVTLIVFSKPSGILYVNHMLLIIILVPSRRPNGIKAIRTPDRSSIYVSWNYSTFDEVGAFFIFKVSATPITTSRHRQSGTPVEKLVLYNETSTTLSVDTSVDYYVTVSYVISNGTNGDIDGPTSEPITPGMIV